MALTWKEPPPKRWDSVAEELRANPGRWAVVELPGVAYTSHIKRGTLKAFRPAGAFEVRSHKGEFFIRYKGDTA